MNSDEALDAPSAEIGSESQTSPSHLPLEVAKETDAASPIPALIGNDADVRGDDTEEEEVDEMEPSSTPPHMHLGDIRSPMGISEVGTMMALQMSQHPGQSERSEAAINSNAEPQTDASEGDDEQPLDHQQDIRWDSLLSNHITSDPRLPHHQTPADATANGPAIHPQLLQQTSLSQQQQSQLANDSVLLYQQPQQGHSFAWDRLAYAATGGLLSGGAASALQSSLPHALGLHAGAVTPTMAALLASGGRWLDNGHGHALFAASGDMKQAGLRKKGFRTEPVPQSGFKGVSWNSRMKAWLAFYVTENGERKSKTFSTRKLGMEEARLQAIAFCKAKQDQRREARKRNRDIVAASSFYSQAVTHPSLTGDSRASGQAPQIYSNAIHAAVYGSGLTQQMASGIQNMNGHLVKEQENADGTPLSKRAASSAEEVDGTPPSAVCAHQHPSAAAAALAHQSAAAAAAAGGSQYYPSIFTHFMFSPQQNGSGTPPHGNGQFGTAASAASPTSEGTPDPRLSPDALLYFSQFLSPPLQHGGGLAVVSDVPSKLGLAAAEKETVPVGDEKMLKE